LEVILPSSRIDEVKIGHVGRLAVDLVVWAVKRTMKGYKGTTKIPSVDRGTEHRKKVTKGAMESVPVVRLTKMLLPRTWAMAME
jgi:hypothetical protein